MATSRRKNQRKPRPADEERQILLDQLKDTASAVGVEVREERLSRGAGYSVRSGPCRIDGREVLFLDSASTLDERINTVVDFLSSRDLDGIWLEPRLRRLIKGPEDGVQEAADGGESA